MSTATIYFHNSINRETASIFRNLCLNAILNHQPTPDSLEIMFSTTGGDVHAGITMYEFLRTLPMPVTMYNVGSVESIGCIIFLGADNRIAMPNTRFKLHGFNWTFGQNTVAFSELTDAYVSLNNDVERYANIFEERTKGAQRIIDVRQCLRGDPLIVGWDEASACGITTAEPSEIKLTFPGVHLYP